MHKRVISFLLSAAIMLGLVCAAAPVTRAASNMTTGDTCVAMIKNMEGFSKYPYYDNGQYTVGYGTTCPPEEYQRYNTYGITEAEAERLLREYLKTFENSLNSFINKNGLNINQGQFDALLSFTYNVGSAWTRSESTFRTAVLEGATGNDFLFAIGRWSTASGKVLKSLVERRLIEANMYLNGVYSNKVPANYKYVIFETNLAAAENEVRVQAYDASVGAAIRAVPTAPGRTFGGWYTQPSGGERVDYLDASVTATTLYAHWSTADSGSQDLGEVIARGVVNASMLKVRSAPGTANPQVGVLNRGEEVAIYEMAQADGMTWGRTTLGWVSLDYVLLEEEPNPGETEPPAQTEPEKPDNTVIATGTVTASSLKIREEAGTDAAQVGTLAKGSTVAIYEKKTVDGIQWGRIEKGWISLDHVELDGAEQVIAIGIMNGTDRLNVRSAPGTYNDIVGYFYRGDTVEIYEKTMLADVAWGRTSLGWISLDYVTMGMEAPVLTAETVESTGQIRLRWNAVAGAAGYQVYRAEGSGEFRKIKSTEGTSLLNTSVTAGKTYSYYVRAVDAGGKNSLASNTVTVSSGLNCPVVRVSNIESTGKIRIQWDAVDGAKSYEVYVASTREGNYELLKTVSGTSLKHTSAVAGNTYYYKVRAVGENSNSDFSSVRYRTCDTARPEISLSTIASTGKIRIAWKAVKGAESYAVYRSDDRDGPWKLLKTVSGTSLNHTSAKAGETWYYYVVAQGSKNAADSAPSAVAGRTCVLARPKVQVKHNASGLPRLTWEKISGADGYKVYRAEGSGEYRLLNTVSGTAMTNTSAKAGVTYSYQVVAVADENVSSAPSKAVTITAK